MENTLIVTQSSILYSDLVYFSSFSHEVMDISHKLLSITVASFHCNIKMSSKDIFQNVPSNTVPLNHKVHLVNIGLSKHQIDYSYTNVLNPNMASLLSLEFARK